MKKASNFCSLFLLVRSTGITCKFDYVQLRALHNLLRHPNTELRGARHPHLMYPSTVRLLRSVRLVFGVLATVVQRSHC